MKMKWTWLASLLLAVSVGLASGDEQKKIVIKGSNTFGEELGPRLIAAFQNEHPEIEFELSTEGSGAGMLALLNGECDLASSSRVASEDELRMARARNVRLRSHFIGSYGVSVIVHADNPLRGLSMAQIRDIFTGEITNWRDVGGPDAKINIYIRDPVSGTYLGFQELAMEYRPYADSARKRLSYPDIIKSVQNDPHSIGYTAMTLVPKDVRAVLVNGIPGNIMSVNEGMYPYARGVRFYTLRGQEPAEAWTFINFVRGSDGQKLLQEMGYVPRAMQRLDTGGIAP